MKFGIELERTLFPLWKSYYVDYEGLKDLLYELKQHFPYFTLFEKHKVFINYDEDEPFKFLVSAVSFTFRDLDSDSPRTRSEGFFKVISIREKQEDYEQRLKDRRAIIDAIVREIYGLDDHGDEEYDDLADFGRSRNKGGEDGSHKDGDDDEFVLVPSSSRYLLDGDNDDNDNYDDNERTVKNQQGQLHEQNADDEQQDEEPSNRGDAKSSVTFTIGEKKVEGEEKDKHENNRVAREATEEEGVSVVGKEDGKERMTNDPSSSTAVDANNSLSSPSTLKSALKKKEREEEFSTEGDVHQSTCTTSATTATSGTDLRRRKIGGSSATRKEERAAMKKNDKNTNISKTNRKQTVGEGDDDDEDDESRAALGGERSSGRAFVFDLCRANGGDKHPLKTEEGSNTKNNQHLLDDRSDSNDDDDDDETETDDSASMSRYGVDPTVKRSPAVKAALESFVYLAKAVVADLSIGGNGQCESLVRHYHENINTARMVQQARMVPVQHDGTAAGGKETSEFAPYEATAVHRGDTSSTMPPIVISAQEAYEAATALLLHDETFAAAFASASAGALLTAPSSYSNPVVVTDEERDERHNNAIVVSDKEERSAVANNRSTARTEMSNSHFSSSHFTKNGVTTRLPTKFARRGLLLKALPVLQRLRSEFCDVVPPTVNHVELFHIDPSTAMMLRRCGRTISYYDKKNAKLSQGARRQGSGKKSSSSSSSLCCSCWPFSGWRSRSTPRARRRRGNNSFAASSGGDQKADQEQQPFFSGGVQMIKDNWDVVTSMLGEDSGEEDDSDNDVTFHSFGSPMRVAQQVNGPMLTAAAAAAKSTAAPPHPASVGPATAGKRDGDYTQDFSSSSSAVVSMRTFTSADNDNRNYSSGADVGTWSDSKRGAVVPPLALGGSGSANASVLSSRALAGLAPGVLGLFVRGGGGEHGCVEGEAIGSVLNIPLAYDEETAAEHYKSNVVENVLEPDSVGYAGPPTPRLGNSSFSRGHQGGGEGGGSSFNSVANAFSNQGDHGNNNNADSSTQNNFSSIASANHDDDNKGATSSLSTQNGSFPPTSQHQQQHSSSETRRSVLAGLRLSIRNIRGSGNKEGNTQNNLHQLHMSSPNFVSNDDETRGSGAGGGRPSPSAGPKTSTSPSFAASLQRFTSAGGGYTRASVASGGGGGAPGDNGSGSLNNNNGSIGGADVSLARRYASTLPFASSLFPTVCPRLHKLHMTHKLGDIRLTMHIYVKSATIAAAPLAPHHQAKMDNSAARSGGYPRTAASADEGGEGTVRKRAVSFYETSTNALKAIGSVGEYLSFVGNEGPTGDQSAPSQQQRKKSAQQQQFQTTRVKDKAQAEDPSVQQKWLVLSEVGYCNPAIAHALYAYQRSVARALAAAVQQEIEKVSSFYLSQSHILCRAALLSIDSVKMWHTLNTRERAQLHTVYRQTYLTFRILHQYCDLNILALGKFLKKADKNLFQNSLKNYQDHLDSLNFRMGHSSRIMALQELMVERLAEHAMGGSNKKAYNFLQTTRDEDSDFLIASGPGQKGGGGGGSGSGGATRLGKNKRTTYTSMAFLGGLLLSLMCMITLLMSEGGTRSGHLTIFDGDAFSKKNAEYLILVPLILAIPQFFFSINVMIYEAYGINFAFMFELDPIFHFTGAELMRDSLIYFVGWAACVYIFLRNSFMLLSCGDCKNSASREDVFTPSVAPLWAIMPLFVFIWLGIAFKNRYYSSERRPFWSAEVFWRILTTPYYPVRFPDFFVLNYLTSLTTVIYELQFYWCTFSTSPAAECSIGRSMSLCILNSLPNTWRMLQCVKRFIVQPKAGRKPFPNLVNGGKYLTGVIQPIVWTMWAVAKYQKRDDSVITALYVLSFASQLIMQTYKYLWDVVVDAGTFIDYGNGYEWRRERVYKAWWPYILFMVVDFVLRWRWLATYYIQLSYKPAWFFFMWSIVELIRRSFWSAFRVENEHVNNTEHYRATKLAPIPVKTIHAWDTFASDASPEQFLSKKKREEFSKEFPSIKGVNLSSVTRYFAGLPEEEKLKILLNSPLCTSFVPPPPSHDTDFSAADSSSVNSGAASKRHDGLEVGLLSSELPNANLTTAPNASHGAYTGQGKTRFFSELPEEHKVIVIITHIGRETMNDFEKRVREEAAAKTAKKTTELNASGGTVKMQGN